MRFVTTVLGTHYSPASLKVRPKMKDFVSFFCTCWMRLEIKILGNVLISVLLGYFQTSFLRWPGVKRSLKVVHSKRVNPSLKDCTHISIKTRSAAGNRQCGKYSTVKPCLCVLERGTSSTCSASSNRAACVSLLLSSSSSSIHSPVSQADCCSPTCAFQQALSRPNSFIPTSAAA